MRAPLILALLLLPQLALGGVVQDQSVPGFFSGPATLAIGGSSQQKLAQTVTAGRSGDLSHVSLVIACSEGSPGTVKVEIQGVDADGFPDGSVLGFNTWPASSLHMDPVFFQDFHIAGVRLRTGEKFAVVISADDEAQCSSRNGPVPGGFFAYPRGAGFFIALPNPLDVWVPLELDRDLPFITWMFTDDNFCDFVTADGEPNDFVPNDVPVCRCLSDPILAHQRCDFDFPDFHLWREIPRPITRPDLVALWHIVPKTASFKQLTVSETALEGGAGAKLSFKDGLPLGSVHTIKVPYKGLGAENEVNIIFEGENGQQRYRFLNGVSADPQKQ